MLQLLHILKLWQTCLCPNSRKDLFETVCSAAWGIVWGEGRPQLRSFARHQDLDWKVNDSSTFNRGSLPLFRFWSEPEWGASLPRFHTRKDQWNLEFWLWSPLCGPRHWCYVWSRKLFRTQRIKVLSLCGWWWISNFVWDWWFASVCSLGEGFAWQPTLPGAHVPRQTHAASEHPFRSCFDQSRRGMCGSSGVCFVREGCHPATLHHWVWAFTWLWMPCVLRVIGMHLPTRRLKRPGLRASEFTSDVSNNLISSIKLYKYI